MSKDGPGIKKGKSRQDIATPWEFIRAVEKRFGKITIDLAATAENAKCENFITPELDTFKQDWVKLINNGLGWLNPEYDPVAPWMEKCAITVAPVRSLEEIRLKVRFLSLTRGSIDANWFWDHIWPNSAVFAVKPRIQFVDQPDPYPAPLILSEWGGKETRRLYRWNWLTDTIE